MIKALFLLLVIILVSLTPQVFSQEPAAQELFQKALQQV